MVAHNENRKVLLTGASGFLGAHVLEVLLRASYHVRATVRSQKKADQVSARYPQYKSQLELVVVEDVAAPNVFDNLVKDVAGVFHTASPFSYNVKDIKADLLDPAINGTLSVLSSAAKSPSVKRVVITSSFVAVCDLLNLKSGYVYTEKDWPPYTYEETAKSGNPYLGYFASKALAEKAAWNFIETKKPSFDIVTINPPYIFGPFVHHLEKLEDLNESLNLLYNYTTKNTEVEAGSAFETDVRDVAEAHLLAFENPKASNQRYLTVAHSFDWQQLVNIVHKNFPGKTKTPVGNPNVHPEHFKVDSSKAEKELGWKFKSLEETVSDNVSQFLTWKA